MNQNSSYMMHDNSYHFFGMHLLWWIIILIIVLLAILLFYRSNGQKSKIDSPLDILKRRLASGAISKEDFIEKKKFIED